jgi:hypothetical protein
LKWRSCGLARHSSRRPPCAARSIRKRGDSESTFRDTHVMNTKPVVLSDKSNSVEETEHKPGVKCTPEEEKVMTTQTQPVSPAKARQVCCDEEAPRVVSSQPSGTTDGTAPTQQQTQELPDSLREWMEYFEGELRTLFVFKKQGLLDWPLVKGSINCVVVSCPVKSLRAELRALRENGVYGSSMAPYLTVMRNVLDTADQCVDETEEAPVVFSESESDSDDESNDDTSSDDDTDDVDTTSQELSQDVVLGDTQQKKIEGNNKRKIEGIEVYARDDAARKKPAKGTGDAARLQEPHGKEPERGLPTKGSTAPTTITTAVGGDKKKQIKGASNSAYQLEMREKYKSFSRFLGTYFAKEHLESAAVSTLVKHPDAAAFNDSEIVAFLDMLQRENKVMLHEGVVMII